MVNESFCTPCQTRLASRPREDDEPHHPDGASFRQALNMGCRICLQAWAAFGHPINLYETTCRLELDEPQEREMRRSLTLSIYLMAPVGKYGVSLIVCLPNDIQIKDVDNNTGSDQAFEFLTATYRKCKERHLKCSNIAAVPYLPPRLLDVGALGQDNISLVDRDHVSPIATAFYATLSHCWGGLQPLKLTSSTSSILHRGISMDFLPKTFQEAVCVARRLDIRWLWIDSLCIMQDDLDDWSTQASAMEDIYHHAVLNIAATAARDGNSGLFQDRNPAAVMPFQFQSVCNEQGQNRTYICTRRGHDIDHAPLNRRAWVMQERELSRRIIHYTSEVLHWECHELVASEIYPEGLPQHQLGFGSWREASLARLVDGFVPEGDIRAQQELIYEQWNLFLMFYTGCKLTYQEDRLVALAGMARRVSSPLQDELVAGIWRKRFIEGLCWHTMHPTTDGGERGPYKSIKVWVAPSWSWASSPYNTKVDGPLRKTDRPRHLVKLVDLSVCTKPSGVLIDGSIQLRCRLIPAKLCFENKSGALLNHMRLEGHEITGRLGLDLQTDNPYFVESVENQDDILLLPILDYVLGNYGTVSGIAVIPSATEADAYQRIGSFPAGWYRTNSSLKKWHDSSMKFYTEVMKRHEQAEDQVIKII